MSATLSDAAKLTIPAMTLDKAKVAAFKVENNQENWIEIWVIYGADVDGRFVEYQDPATGHTIPVTYIKLETGSHPLRPGTALRKCSVCGKWLSLSLCDEPGCEDASALPYDGFARAAFMETGQNQPYHVMKSAIYSFVMSEIVPDPDTWENRPLIDISAWT